MTATNRLNTGGKCVANVDADAVTPTYRRQRGFLGPILRNGAGDLTLTLNEPIDATTGDLIILTGVNHAGMASIAVQVVSATQLRIRTGTLGPDNAIFAADLDFWLALDEIGPN